MTEFNEKRDAKYDTELNALNLDVRVEESHVVRIKYSLEREEKLKVEWETKISEKLSQLQKIDAEIKGIRSRYKFKKQIYDQILLKLHGCAEFFNSSFENLASELALKMQQEKALLMRVCI